MQTQVTPLQLSNQPFDRYAKMRRESPVYYDAEQQSWMVFRYEDVKQVFANWQMFSSKIPHPPEQTDFTQSLNFTDPPKHRSLRSLVAKVFTARRVEELAPRMIEITNELIDRVQAQGQMDFIHDFAIPLPVIVIAEILGVPVERRADFKHWSDGIMESNQAAYRAMGDYFRELIQQRTGKPGHDLVSDLIAVHEGSETLSAQELVDFCMVLLVAGNETTTNLLANTIVCLHEYPETYDRLRKEPALLNLAIEKRCATVHLLESCLVIQRSRLKLADNPFRLSNWYSSMLGQPTGMKPSSIAPINTSSIVTRMSISPLVKAFIFAWVRL